MNNNTLDAVKRSAKTKKTDQQVQTISFPLKWPLYMIINFVKYWLPPGE